MESKKIYQLAKDGYTWTKVSIDDDTKIPDSNSIEDKCTLCVSQDTSGKRKWLATTAMQFQYSVEEVSDIFSSAEQHLLILREGEKNSYYVNGEKLRRLVFVDQTVHLLYGRLIEAHFKSINVLATIISILTIEETKSVITMLDVLKAIDDFNPDRRNEPIIAIGGGVCLDIVGLAATLYRRRTPYIRIPTTLLALVDASVGAKSGVNFCDGKNKLGAYVPPIAVFLDKSFLKTLPQRHLSNGMGEIMKIALMKSLTLFEVLEEHGENLIKSALQNQQGDYVIAEAVELMLEELTPNLWENDLDRIVDFGHVISPTLEMDALPSLLHGEAVSIDIALMCHLSNKLTFLTKETVNRIITCMRKLGLPVYHDQCTEKLMKESMKKRLKHGNGKLRLPIPIEIGNARIINDVTDDMIRAAFKSWKEDSVNMNYN